MFKQRMDAVPVITGVNGEPNIFVTPIALEKMFNYVKECSKEIGWLGTVTRFDKNIFLVEDVFLFKQEVHATTCEITPEGIANFVCDLYVKDPENADEIINKLKLWGHSHVNMGVSPSGQDNDQMNTFKDANPWFLRVIGNKSGELEFSLFDFTVGLQYRNVKWREYRVHSTELEEQIKAEIKEKVTEKTYATTTSMYANRGWGKYYDDDDWGAYGTGYQKKTTEVISTSQTKLTVVGKEDEDIIYLRDKQGIWNKVPRRDANGRLKEDVIAEEFTTQDLIYISQAEDVRLAKYLIEESEPSNTYSDQDVADIFSYACTFATS